MAVLDRYSKTGIVDDLPDLWRSENDIEFSLGSITGYRAHFMKNGTDDVCSKLNEILGRIGSARARLRCSGGIFRIAADFEVPENVEILPGDGYFSVDSGKTLNLLGNNIALPEMFGAVCGQGKSDAVRIANTKAINDAIAAMEARGRVWFASKIYEVNGQIFFNPQGKYYGDGFTFKRYSIADSDGAAIVSYYTGTGPSFSTIGNGNDSSVSPVWHNFGLMRDDTTGPCFYAKDITIAYIDRMGFIGGSEVFQLDSSVRCWQNRITNCRFQSGRNVQQSVIGTEIGVHLMGSSVNEATFSMCYITDVKQGLVMDDGGHNTFSQVEFARCTRGAVWLKAATTETEFIGCRNEQNMNATPNGSCKFNMVVESDCKIIGGLMSSNNPPLASTYRIQHGYVCTVANGAEVPAIDDQITGQTSSAVGYVQSVWITLTVNSGSEEPTVGDGVEGATSGVTGIVRAFTDTGGDWASGTGTGIVTFEIDDGSGTPELENWNNTTTGKSDAFTSVTTDWSAGSGAGIIVIRVGTPDGRFEAETVDNTTTTTVGVWDISSFTIPEITVVGDIEAGNQTNKFQKTVVIAGDPTATLTLTDDILASGDNKLLLTLNDGDFKIAHNGTNILQYLIASAKWLFGGDIDPGNLTNNCPVYVNSSGVLATDTTLTYSGADNRLSSNRITAGSLEVGFTTITAGTYSDFTNIGEAVTIIECNATAGTISQTLNTTATEQNKRVLTFIKNDASANTVTIVPAGSDTIEGAASYVLSNRWDKVTIWCRNDSSIWRILWKNP